MPEIVPFAEQHYAAAATLLAQRGRRDRQACPLLPAPDPGAMAALIADLAGQPGAAAAAVAGERLLGYLLGEVRIDQTWGRSAWMPLGAWALDADVEPALLGDLYAALGDWWVRQGIFDHYVLVPAADQSTLMQWFTLGFAMQQVHAVIDLAPFDQAPDPPGDILIRRAGPADRELLADLSRLIWTHQIQAPIWGVTLPERALELRAGYAALADDDEATVWLAFVADQAVGFQAYFPAEAGPGDLLTPPQSVEVSVAGVLPAFRGWGVAQALTAQGFAHARAAGAAYCIADWRSANRAAAGFWAKSGFTPVAYRLFRHVDPRIVWTYTGQGLAG